MRQRTKRSTHASLRIPVRIVALAAAGLLTACDAATAPGVPTHFAAASPTSLTATVATEVTPAPSVRVTDQHDNPVQGIEVLFWGVAFENGVMMNSSRTGVDGTATVAAWRLGTQAGTQTLRAVPAVPFAPAVHGVTFTATATAGAAARITALDPTQTTPPRSKVALRAKVVDEFVNPVAGVLVIFAIESGDGSLANTSARTDGGGIARAEWTVGVSGENSVTASVAALEPVRFIANVAMDAVLYYDLVEVTVGSMSMTASMTAPPGWITVASGNLFTTSVRSYAGNGVYAISGGSIIFTYGNDFLENLGKGLDWWAYPYSLKEERGTISADYIVIRRCWNEDCYEGDWKYKRRAP